MLTSCFVALTIIVGQVGNCQILFKYLFNDEQDYANMNNYQQSAWFQHGKHIFKIIMV